MKTILLCMMLMLSGMLTAQTVDNPPFKARSGSIGNITRIERTPDGTRVYIHAIFRPHWWIKEEGDSYPGRCSHRQEIPVQECGRH